MSRSDASDLWDHSASSALPREFLVSVEVYVSNAASAALRKPPIQRKKTDRRDSLKHLASSTEDGKKVKEKSSRINLARAPTSAGHWRQATCKLLEEDERCLLNIYVDETILYQTVYVHLLNHTDIRHADCSLFFRKNCIGIYCVAGKRWSLARTAEPLYVQFANIDACNTWLALLRSYAIPEIYGRWFFPADGGSYRMWRQVELTVIQGRNMGSTKTFVDALASSSMADAESYSEPDSVDLDVSCEIHLNNTLCGRTTVKKGIGSPEWHESFTFPDLPPFETLEIIVWREKKLFKPTMMGSVRVTLSNFRRGETVEGWFPVLHSGPIGRDLHIGDIRLKIRVDEEIILPLSSYSELFQTFNSRNFLDWMTDFESKLRLKNTSNQLLSIAVAKNALIEQVFDFADREVDGTPSSHNTLFRGNTVLTKIMELSMSFYGKAFLEASVGNVLRRLCAEKVAIEVDPLRSAKGIKDVERNVEQLIYWCQAFWTQIYSVRTECPHELRRLFEYVRKLVERRYRIKDTTQDQNRELPWQSVSAFCFLRFIVPAILHPHLFGLSAGLPSASVQRSLTLIAKVIQSLANLNATVQKEEFMRGVKDFLRDSLPAMIDYILVVSTPVSDPHSHYSGSSGERHERLKVVDTLRQRTATMPMLDREAIPILPHLLDIPKHLAVVSSAVIRGAKEYKANANASEPSDRLLEEFCNRCYQVEERALRRVSQLASRASSTRRPSVTSVGERYQEDSQPTLPIPVPGIAARITSSRQKRVNTKPSRPSTAPSSPDQENPRTRELRSVGSLPCSPVSVIQPSPRLVTSNPQLKIAREISAPESREQGSWSRRGQKLLHLKSTSTDGISVNSGSTTEYSKTPLTEETADDATKVRKGLLRGILTRR